MVVQLDIDGTIDRAPEFFAWMSTALLRDGHRVLVVTSRTTSPENIRLTAEGLRAFGIVYNRLLLSPAVDDLDPGRLPPSLLPTHRLFVYKLIAAQDHGTEILFDDCKITSDIFRRHSPDVRVYRPLRPEAGGTY
ncbi:MAG: hypothetical protein COR54_02270 [Elusimicrobia bacterium CG22_combo_CG10-13_8_21_14_all_63_91]|nr:MAG: hypothetical protein COR54_02270 [Elusimicrobia bacterium CG22_combo_CG10-13_8_21_14_all_63_91]PJA14710.1 MAG: hypothetical protein COX66_11900 [Elusimicrobia bacterium CG_4_10_14_0_2_um_filter_63_34]